jgi:MFS family permease
LTVGSLAEIFFIHKIAVLKFVHTMSVFRSLKHSNFALLWTGQTISRLGDHLYRIALAWWVLEKTGSAAAMGTVLIFSSVPMLIFLLVGGVTVDRFSRVRVMLLSDILRGALGGVVTLLAFTNRLELWHIYVVSILFGFVSAFFQPAYIAIIPDILPSEGRLSANSLTALSGQLTGIAGPAIGASIIALGGTASAFALDAISFFISGLCLLPILRLTMANASPRLHSHPLEDFREGWRAVISVPWLWITIALAAFANLTQAGPYLVGLPFLVKTNLGNDVRILGWLFSAASLGSVVAALWLGHVTQLRHRGWISYIGLAIWGLTLLILGLPIGLPFLLVTNFLMMASLNVFNLIWTNTLQEMVPHDLLGRVSSIDYLGSFVLLPIGYGVAGWAIDLLGVPAVFIIGGTLTALLALLGLLHPAIRNLD